MGPARYTLRFVARNAVDQATLLSLFEGAVEPARAATPVGGDAGGVAPLRALPAVARPLPGLCLALCSENESTLFQSRSRLLALMPPPFECSQATATAARPFAAQPPQTQLLPAPAPWRAVCQLNPIREVGLGSVIVSRRCMRWNVYITTLPQPKSHHVLVLPSARILDWESRHGSRDKVRAAVVHCAGVLQPPCMTEPVAATLGLLGRQLPGRLRPLPRRLRLQGRFE